MKKSELKKVIRESIKEQFSSGIPSYTHTQSSPQYPGDPDGPFPGSWDPLIWMNSWVGLDQSFFPSGQNRCNFLYQRFSLWSNQINDVGPLHQNLLHAKLRILHRAFLGSGC